MRKTRWMNWPAAALALVVVLLVGYQALGMRHLVQIGPTVVVTVDLERIFNNLDEREHADRELQALANELQREISAAETEIRRLEEELDALVPGTESHQNALRKYSHRSAEYRADVQLGQMRIDAEKSMILRRIYDHIKKSIADEARERGYDIVYVNDSLGELPPGTEEETSRQISARRVLFANDRVDITDDIIRRMNSAFQARGER